jgi:protease II
MNSGTTIKDITPTGFTTGSANAVGTTGYGYGSYGHTVNPIFSSTSFNVFMSLVHK